MPADVDSNVTVLFITNNGDDYAGLSSFIAKSPAHLESQCHSLSSGSVRAAVRLIRNKRIAIVLCEHRMGDSVWRDLLEETAGLPDGPHVIVTSRTADEQLWSEALNLGAYDVLATPFNPEELERVLSSALARWNNRANRPPAAVLTAGQ